MFLYNVFPFWVNGSYFCNRFLPSTRQMLGQSCMSSDRLTTKSPGFLKECETIRQCKTKIHAFLFYPKFTLITMLILLLLLRYNLMHSMLRLTVHLSVHHLLIMLILLRLINGHVRLVVHSTRLWIVTGIEFRNASTFDRNCLTIL